MNMDPVLDDVAERAAFVRVQEPVYTITRPGEGLRDLAGIGFTPEHAEGLHPGVAYLIRTGLFPVDAPLSMLEQDFVGGTSRFAASQGEE